MNILTALIPFVVLCLSLNCAAFSESDEVVAKNALSSGFCIECKKMMENTAEPVGARKLASEPPGRIQGDNWNGNPLTEIVHIKGTLLGTGALLPNCRVLTNLHLFMPLEEGHLDQVRPLKEGETLVGKKFQFTTNPRPIDNNDPRPTDGKSLTGHLTILAHGNVTSNIPSESSPEEWAIARDEDCLSQKARLGYIKISSGLTFEEMQLNNYVAATFSKIEKLPSFDGHRLYVDSMCGVKKKVTASYYLTDCSVDHGGSGGQLLTTQDGVIGDNGYPQLFAHGMFHYGEPNSDIRGPNVDHAEGIVPFTSAVMRKIRPYLEPDQSATLEVAGNTNKE